MNRINTRVLSPESPRPIPGLPRPLPLHLRDPLLHYGVFSAARTMYYAGDTALTLAFTRYAERRNIVVPHV